MPESSVQRRLAAILAADVAGYSRLMGADEEGTLAGLRAHRAELIDPCIAENDGRIVKTTGDGALVEFASAVDAVRCALDIQRGMATRNADVAPDRRIAFLHLGDYAAAEQAARDRIARNPQTDASRVLLAAALGHQGRAEEARAAWDELLRVNPRYSFAQRRRVLPYKDPAAIELVAQGLAKAGIAV